MMRAMSDSDQQKDNLIEKHGFHNMMRALVSLPNGKARRGLRCGTRL